MSDALLRILHVEDNPDHALLVRRTLAGSGMTSEISLVEDGAAALDYLYHRGDYDEPEASPRPHVILLDLRVPKVDGLEVLRVVKSDERLLSIPVVVLTSSDAEADVASAYERHANSYLVKPIGFEKFTDMLHQLGLYWLAWNQYPWAAYVS